VITQPEGASFSLSGNEVKWQNWTFRFSMHPREGLVLHTVSYDDHGMARPVLYRASLSEMMVPYGHNDAQWTWRAGGQPLHPIYRPMTRRVTRGAWKSARCYDGAVQGRCRGRLQTGAAEPVIYRDPGAAGHPGLLRPDRGTARVSFQPYFEIMRAESEKSGGQFFLNERVLSVDTQSGAVPRYLLVTDKNTVTARR